MKIPPRFATRFGVIALSAGALATATGLAVANLGVAPGFAGADLGAAADVGQLPQEITVPSGEWVYGKLLHFTAADSSSGNPVSVTSATPDVCMVEGSGADLRLVGVGGCSVTLRQAGDAQYAPAVRSLNLVVAPRPLHVFVPDATRISGARNPDPMPTIDGLVAGDRAADIIPTVLDAPTKDTRPGRYPVTISWGGSPNYQPTVTRSTLTIDPVVVFKGLPAGVSPGLTANGAVVGNGYWAPVALVYAVPWNSQLTYTRLIEATGGPYVTSTSGSLSATGSWRITYSTIPELIEQSSMDESQKSDALSSWKEALSYRTAGDEGDLQVKLLHLKGLAATKDSNLLSYLEVLDHYWGGST